MYKLSRNTRQYSCTPLVKVTIDSNGKEIEQQVLFSPLPKKEGEQLLVNVALLLNKEIANNLN